jgi:cell shape-determining protein MreC
MSTPSSFNYPFFLLAIVLAVLRFTKSDYHFGIFEPFLQIYMVYVNNYTTVNANIYNTIIVVGDRNTEQHYPETHIVDSSMEDLEQYNAESDIVDSSMEDLEQYNAESVIVDSSTVELEQFDEDDIEHNIGK